MTDTTTTDNSALWIWLFQNAPFVAWSLFFVVVGFVGFIGWQVLKTFREMNRLTDLRDRRNKHDR